MYQSDHTELSYLSSIKPSKNLSPVFQLKYNTRNASLLLIPTSNPQPPEKYVNLLKSMQNLMKCNKHIYKIGTIDTLS